MNRDIKEYLPFYLGSDFRYRYVDWEKGSWTPITKLNGKDIEKMEDLSIEKIELFILPLSAITEDQVLEIAKMVHVLPSGWFEGNAYKIKEVEYPNTGIEVCALNKYAIRITFRGDIYFHDYTKPNAAIYLPGTPFIIKHLLEKGFDLFGLIGEGLAIDKTKYKEKTSEHY